MEDETADGWTLRMAVRHLLPEAHQKILAAALLAAEIARDLPGIAHYQPIVWGFLLEQVISHSVAVTGFPPEATRRRPIEIDIVRHATTDFGTSELRIGASVWSGVRFRKTLIDTSATLGWSERPDGSTVETPGVRAAQWMTENVTVYVPNQRDKKVAECRLALGILKEQALIGWNALPEAIKGKSRLSIR